MFILFYVIMSPKTESQFHHMKPGQTHSTASTTRSYLSSQSLNFEQIALVKCILAL